MNADIPEVLVDAQFTTYIVAPLRLTSFSISMEMFPLPPFAMSMALIFFFEFFHNRIVFKSYFNIVFNL